MIYVRHFIVVTNSAEMEQLTWLVTSCFSGFYEQVFHSILV